MSVNWGTSVTPSLLTALIGNVGERAEARLGIAVHRDPDINLHRRAQSTVGDIETEMNSRMQSWGNPDAKDYDRKSVWAMLTMRDSSAPCPRICDSKWLFLARNTALVKIANNAWTAWLKGSTKHSSTHIEKWAPVAMSDKQFAGYLWMRSGGSDASIPRARLIAHCSAAVRPRADVKARAYNLVLELSGKDEADDVAAILEDREGGRALMRATRGDPEDVTKERLPFIMEQVKLAAGEFAAARVREEAGRQLELVHLGHNAKVKQLSADKTALETAAVLEAKNANRTLLQMQHDKENLERKNVSLALQIDAQIESGNAKKHKILNDGLAAGVRQYQVARQIAAIVFSLACAAVAYLSPAYPVTTASIIFLLSYVGFWFVPDELLSRPFRTLAMRKLRSVVATKDATIEIPNPDPDFKNGIWSAIDK